MFSGIEGNIFLSTLLLNLRFGLLNIGSNYGQNNVNPRAIASIQNIE